MEGRKRYMKEKKVVEEEGRRIQKMRRRENILEMTTRDVSWTSS